MQTTDAAAETVDDARVRVERLRAALDDVRAHATVAVERTAWSSRSAAAFRDSVARWRTDLGATAERAAFLADELRAAAARLDVDRIARVGAGGLGAGGLGAEGVGAGGGGAGR